MFTRSAGVERGLDSLRRAVWAALDPGGAVVPPMALAGAAGAPAVGPPRRRTTDRLGGWPIALSEAAVEGLHEGRRTSSHEDPDEADRLVALVDLARDGDAEAFGALYDHYQPAVFRFLYYRVGSVALAEDLLSETFFRALRSMGSFRWQGKDFAAWLMTIARNLVTDHLKSGRNRYETPTDELLTLDSADGRDGPEDQTVSQLTNEILLRALQDLPEEQQDCLVMRFLQGLSIAETAAVLGRSAGAVKQLQLRAVRSLAKALPEGFAS